MKFSEIKENTFLSLKTNNCIYAFILEKNKDDIKMLFFTSTPLTIYVSKDLCSIEEWEDAQEVFIHMSQVYGRLDYKVFLDQLFGLKVDYSER